MGGPAIPIDPSKWKKFELDLDAYVKSIDQRLKTLTGTVLDLRHRIETLEATTAANTADLSGRIDHYAYELSAVKRVVIDRPVNAGDFFDPNDAIPGGVEILTKRGYYDHHR